MNPDDNNFKDEILEEEVKNAPKPEDERAEVTDKKGSTSRIILIILLIILLLLFIIPEGINKHEIAADVSANNDYSLVNSTLDSSTNDAAVLLSLLLLPLEGAAKITGNMFNGFMGIFGVFSAVGAVLSVIAMIFCVICVIAFIYAFPKYNKWIRIAILVGLFLPIGYRTYYVINDSGILGYVNSNGNIVYKGERISSDYYVEYKGYYYFKEDKKIKSIHKNFIIVHTLESKPLPEEVHIAFNYKNNIYLVEDNSNLYYKFDINTKAITNVRLSGTIIPETLKDNIIYSYGVRGNEYAKNYIIYKIDLDKEKTVETINYDEKATSSREAVIEDIKDYIKELIKRWLLVIF